jgi:hypothetical protein
MFSSSYRRQQSQDEPIFKTDFLHASGQEAGTPESNVPLDTKALLKFLHEQGSNPELEHVLPRDDAAGREEPVAAESLLSQTQSALNKPDFRNS